MFVIPFTHTSQLSRAASRSLPLAPGVEQLVADTFDNLLGRRPGADATRTPALDVSETDTAYHLAFEVPGVRKDQLKVTVEGRRVGIETIAAADVVDADAKEVAAPRALYRERRAARYARTVSLPAEVDQSASQARFDNGVLTLVLAKKVPTGATELSIS